LDRPTSGQVLVGGRALENLSEGELSGLRSATIGFIFQFHHLLREFTVLENVMMPQLIQGRKRSDAKDRACELLSDVGLSARLKHKPGQLSGGEQQRVAVARALANQPLAVLADEPSGNLDPTTSDRLHDLLFSVSEIHGTAMILVTHNMRLAGRSDRVLEVQEGALAVSTVDAFDYTRRSVG
jgi:lipoprotein-releasing system ATP-binding protein